jgi:hypothetical protein
MREALGRKRAGDQQIDIFDPPRYASLSAKNELLRSNVTVYRWPGSVFQLG